MFTVALFIAVKNGNNTNAHQLAIEGINKMWYVDNIEYFLPVKHESSSYI